jgi:hypothetical protein
VPHRLRSKTIRRQLDSFTFKMTFTVPADGSSSEIKQHFNKSLTVSRLRYTAVDEFLATSFIANRVFDAAYLNKSRISVGFKFKLMYILISGSNPFKATFISVRMTLDRDTSLENSTRDLWICSLGGMDEISCELSPGSSMFI